MPVTKKVVNPEKELRGKKPYNRAGPGGLKKKSYQAKPKKLDEGEVPEGAAALKKKIRDTLRLLSNPKMPADVRLEQERRIEALKLQIAEKQVDQTEQKMAIKYRFIKFVESKKADRKIKVFLRQHPDWESNEEEKKELNGLKLDLAYVEHYPKTLKYISLYPSENVDDPVVSKARNEIRDKIKAGLDSGEIAQFVKAAREEVKAKIISKDTLSTEEAVRLTAENINKSKKRARDEQDPLSGRAKATAERDAIKPKHAVEDQETFFETVPKVVAAGEAVKEPANKKTTADKKAEKKTVAPAQQPKKEQPKKKENAAVTVTAKAVDPSAETGDVAKLGKWARKALRAQSAFKAKEGSTAQASDSATDPATAPMESVVAVEEVPLEKVDEAVAMEVEAIEKKPAEKKPVEKKPVEKKPVEKKPVEKKPVEKKPVEKKPVEKKPVEKKPVEKKPAEKKPVEKKPVEKKLVEKKPVEKKPVEKKPAEKKPVEKKPVEKKPAEKKPVEKKPAEKKPAEKKPVEKKPAEKKPVEKKPVEKKPVEKKPVEKKPVEKKPVEKKPVEKKVEQQDAPKITTLKVDLNDRGESDSEDDGNEETATPVRKVVKVDESLLKELPEVPKRRGGRNLNKFKK